LNALGDLKVKVCSSKLGMAEHFGDLPSAHQGHVPTATIIPRKAKTVCIPGAAVNMAEKVVMKEVKRFKVEYLLQANHIGIGMGENCRSQPTVSEVQCSCLRTAVLRHVLIASAIKARTASRTAKSKILNVECCDAHRCKRLWPPSLDCS
jgi:hypothetical protein